MHPSMPQEPLVILHCALQRGAASSMNDILHPHQLQLANPSAVGKHTFSTLSQSTFFLHINSCDFITKVCVIKQDLHQKSGSL